MRHRATSEEVRTRTEKLCGSCQTVKPLTDFHRSKYTGDGRKNACKICRNEYARAHPHYPGRGMERYARHRKFLDSLKSDPCLDCGESFHPAVMNFHHIGEKTIEVAKLVNHSPDVIRAEVAKCVLLCSNCHIMRHVIEREESKVIQ